MATAIGRRGVSKWGHLALVTLETLLKHLTLITQNVDGLHQRAGSSQAIEINPDTVPLSERARYRLPGRGIAEGCPCAAGWPDGPSS